jgi:hypothetical protein
MHGTGVELELDPGALEQLNRGAAGRLPAGPQGALHREPEWPS